MELIFLKVKTNREKLQRLSSVVEQWFNKGERVLILVETPAVAAYMDEFLWKYTAESFLPHEIVEEPSEERVCITQQERNLNHASVVINLCPQAKDLFEEVSIFYEFFDETQDSKREASSQKWDHYKKQFGESSPVKLLLV